MPILGDMAEAFVEVTPRRLVRHVVGRQFDAAGLDRSEARDGVDQLGLPVAVNARNTDDLAGSDLERHVPNLLEPTVVANVQALYAEECRCRSGRSFVDLEKDFSPDHERRELFLGRAFGRQCLYDLSSTQDGYTVRDVENFIQLVADEDDRHAFARERPEDPEQLDCLLGRQDGGRLVEDEDVRSSIERLQDLDALLLPDSDVLNEGVGIDRKAERLREMFHGPSRGPVVQEHSGLSRLHREDDVLGNGHHRDEHEVLVHHPDAARDGLLRRRHLDGFAATRISPSSGW